MMHLKESGFDKRRALMISLEVNQIS